MQKSMKDNINENNKIIIPIYFLVDTSDNMRGEKISKVNKLLNECLACFKKFEDAYNEFEIKVVMFSGAKKKQKVSINSKVEFVATENSNISNLLLELNKDLLESKYVFPSSINLLIGDKSNIDCENVLNSLKHNYKFRCSFKMAIVYSDYQKNSHKSLPESLSKSLPKLPPEIQPLWYEMVIDSTDCYDYESLLNFTNDEKNL